MAKRTTRKKGRGRLLPGVSLELAVARIQQMMDPDSTVSHNETLLDRLGNRRQFDVVIRGTFGGRPVLGVIECRDHSRKKGPDAVEGFAKKTEHLGANLRLMVSRKGFTRQALRLAAHERIGFLSLLPNDPHQVGFAIGHFWYGILQKWTDVYLVIHFPFSPPPNIGPDFDKVRWQGLPVTRWFLRELFTTHSRPKEPGEYSLALTFKQPMEIEIEGAAYPVIGLTCRATWVQKNKRTWCPWSGDAFYDWHTGEINVPGGVSLIGGPVENDIALWDDYDGVVPTESHQLPPHGMSFVLRAGQRLPEGYEVPDLAPRGSGMLLRKLTAPEPSGGADTAGRV
jgi:hypothetical protein